MLIILASCGLGFAQEYRASRIVAALTARLAVKASVLRDGILRDIDLLKVVEGDVFQLQAGSLVPADAVVLHGRDLMAEEAALTGESFPVAKAPAVPHQALTESNFVHVGTSIRSGSGRALALHVGASTQYGQIERSSLQVQPVTAFAVGVRRFGMMLTRVMLVIVSLVLAMNVILGRPVLDSLLFAAALAVGLTPELLPAVVTVTQASGARRLAQAGVLVKQLVAIENLGAMEVLCTDKTGTLTEGDVRLDRALDCFWRQSLQSLV
ncbi:HAD-IC family P-type ATPase [Devosia sp. FJ2-5-3]|uniref:HAD-IC family P-type ATPase n=1 Tax=Devosia sp. FJ2-5-3 TaxID=2976680 RepID=UPI0023D7C40D|nr:HAD-IC family P-type ATPase [Devosia sp. FJ2-5-3]WEJ56886.1 HAD-IC family P-type ATPase [Devosia sp. FJ2-5-3]